METKIPVIEALEKIGCARNTLYKLMNLHGIETSREGNQRFLERVIYISSDRSGTHWMRKLDANKLSLLSRIIDHYLSHHS